tara:strand:- start:238 stop:561 length:324 start_codon:yes stop_codon:yes gene_type:complete
MDLNKLSQYFKDYIDNIKAGFIPDGDLNGVKGFISRITNLWRHSLQGKITILMVCIIGLAGLSDSSSSSSSSYSNSSSKPKPVKVKKCWRCDSELYYVDGDWKCFAC